MNFSVKCKAMQIKLMSTIDVYIFPVYGSNQKFNK